MTGQRTVWRTYFAALAAGALLTPAASAFFPPITTPIIVPPGPTDPIIVVPPVDPIIKPPLKPKPKPDCCCYCGGNEGTANTPEPATMVSAGIGLAVMGAAGWIKRRRKSA